MYSRSRSVFAAGDCAFCISSQPAFIVSGSGRSQIWWNLLMAIPQWAMAQLGSVLAMRSNCGPASSYQKSWSRATPRLKEAWTSGEQDIAKDTVPSFSSGEGDELIGMECVDWANAAEEARSKQRKLTFMASAL